MTQLTIKTLGKTGRLSRTKVLSVLKTLRKQKKPNGAHQSNGKLDQSDTASGQGLIQFRANTLFKEHLPSSHHP